LLYYYYFTWKFMTVLFITVSSDANTATSVRHDLETGSLNESDKARQQIRSAFLRDFGGGGVMMSYIKLRSVMFSPHTTLSTA
jgi:hypothetical protein